MGRTERLFRITSLLRGTKSLRFDEILQRLGISPATLKRDLRYLREQLGTPIAYDAFDRTYRIEAGGVNVRQELPGLWFSEAELHALAFAYRLLEQLDPNQKLVPRLKSVIDRCGKLMSHASGRNELIDRIRLIVPGKREVDGDAFDVVTTAMAQRRQVRIRYFTRSRQDRTQRDVSPQRMVFSRTWYLDAWCHKTNDLRRFALDAVEAAETLEAPAKDVSLRQLERLFDGAYGTFPGEPKRWATLLFSQEAALWVERETWHPMQRMHRQADGRLELSVPYRDPTELAMDVLRHGDQVEVVGDDVLVRAMRSRVRALAIRYRT
jgi:predicted DNA-binding transcriptional regulator YafY